MKEKNINGVLNSATEALNLLKEWLSISESQICSTEVLSEELPKVNKLLEDSINDIATHFSKVAENTNKISKEIDYIDQRIDTIDVKGKPAEITALLKEIAHKTSDDETKKNLNSIVTKINKQEKELHKELQKATDIIKENTSEISEIVIGMQFQDRVSQNILITINIMKAIVTYLDQAINDSMPELTKDDRKKLLNKEFAKHMLEQLRLGDLQTSFINHLLNHGYIQDASELGFSLDAHEKKEDSDDIDLF